MSKKESKIAILGCGPAGMAAGLALLKAGHNVSIIERYREAKPAGGILGLWPPALKALNDMDVDMTGLGAPCHITFRSATGHKRVDVKVPEKLAKDIGATYYGLLRPDLYSRMQAALPEGTIRFGQHLDKITTTNNGVQLHFPDGVEDFALLIGADGIDSVVRKHLWGDSPKRPHNVHVIGGYTFEDIPEAEAGEIITGHSRTVQGSYSEILSNGKKGHQWWTLESWPDGKGPPDDLLARASYMAQEFPPALQGMISKTDISNVVWWPIRDRVPLERWSKGRITLSGDAAHPVSPYAGYGVGMAICDGYYLGQLLHGVNLEDTAAVESVLYQYEQKRIPHTTEQIKQAYILTYLFHQLPWPLAVIRDFILDNTSLLQAQVGDKSAQEIFSQLEEMGDGILSK